MSISSIGIPSGNALVGHSPRRRRPIRIRWTPVLFISPALLLVAAVSLYPILDAIDLSLHQTKFANTLGFIGFGNYAALLADPTVWRDLGNSGIYTIGSLLLVLPYSMAVALLLNRRLPMRGLFRTLAIIPWVISQTITALLWSWILNADFGVGTYAVQSWFGDKVAALASTAGAMTSLIGVNVWCSYPMAALLFLAALQTIPEELYQAAEVDGASKLAQFRFVTLPLVKQTALVVLIQLTLQYFNMVTLIYVLTGGGPLGSTETLAVRVLKMSFENWELGRASALGLLITFVNIVFSLVYMRALKGASR